MAPTLDTGLAVETWRRSPFLPTYCPPEYDYVVANVQYIRLAGDPEPIKYTRLVGWGGGGLGVTITSIPP